MAAKAAHLKPVALTVENSIAVTLWVEMGGKLDRELFDLLVEFHGVNDVELVVRSLLQLQAYQRQIARMTAQ